MNPASATRAELRLLERLQRGRDRRREGLCLVEGERLLGECLHGGRVPLLVVAETDVIVEAAGLLEAARAAGSAVRQAPATAVARLSDRRHARGLVAAVPLPPPWERAVPPRADVLVPCLCGVQDPGNVGTLLRSARAFGAPGALLLEGTADPGAPKVVRGSAGASLTLPCARGGALEEVVAWAGAAGLEPVAAVARAGDGPCLLPEQLPGRVLLLLGHETRGVPADPGIARVTIPTAGGVESLNVAMAGAVLMAAWYRTRAG